MVTSAQIKAIHTLKSRARLGEDDYRGLLRQIGGVESSTKLTPGKAIAVIDRLKQLAGQPKAVVAPGGRAHVGKVLELWQRAAATGVIRNGSEEALRAFVKRQTKGPDAPDGVAAPQFLTPKQANRVIEGLKAMLARGAA